MDTCRDIELELVAYCSGELDLVERDLVERHLDGCASCREELARETRLRSTLGKMPAQACPEILVSRIEAAAAPLGSVAAIPRQRSRWLPTLAFAAAAGLALVLLLPASGPQQEWTEQEIAAARKDLMYTLALTAEVFDRTQKNTMIEVFADKLPHAINKSFKKMKPTTTGGKG
jgi:anti-sigma factor RsiW